MYKIHSSKQLLTAVKCELALTDVFAWLSFVNFILHVTELDCLRSLYGSSSRGSHSYQSEKYGKNTRRTKCTQGYTAVKETTRGKVAYTR